MVITVHSLNSVLIVFWMRSSVSRSTAAVASSRTRILVFLRRALARQTNWRWPTLKTMYLLYNVFFLQNGEGTLVFFVKPLCLFTFGDVCFGFQSLLGFLFPYALLTDVSHLPLNITLVDLISINCFECLNALKSIRSLVSRSSEVP